jgi:hypothetical protein
VGINTEKLKKEILKRLEKLEKSEIEISGKTYPLYIFDKDEDINLFEGIFFAEGDRKEDISNFLGYKPTTGYVGRVGILIYRNEDLLIRDFRANRQIRKTIAKINEPFLKKLKKALEEPKDENFSALLSRSDVVEEFYVLYKKCREFLLNNIRGISEEERREEFVDNFMMQMLTLWYLQEKGFFNRDKRYFITKFMDLKQKRLFGGFESYYAFLRHFFRKISGYSNEPYVEKESIGRCVVIGPAVFLNGEDDEAVTIPDKCFYQEGVTEKLVNLTPKGRRRMISEKDIDFDIPLLNLFESRDWVDGDIDEYVLGSLYEKLITYMERKKLGAFYTPEEITSYICKNTIEPYLVDRINEDFGKSYESIDEIINAGEKEELLTLFDLLQNIKILDPAVGSAHFLESAINVLVDIYRKLRDRAKEVGIEKLKILVADEDGKIKPLNLLEIPEKEGLFEVYVKFFIILSRNIYGVDINPSALKIARARLFLTLARHFNVNAGVFIRFPNVHFNLREGNSLIGYVDVPRGRGEIKQVTLDFEFEDHEIEYIQERIKVDEELKEYLPEIARSLKIEGDLVKEIQEMNRILSSKKIRWSEFEKVLRTKEKLIQVLVASLNSRYAVKLNKLLKSITDLFNKKLDEKFADEHGIDLDELKKIKTFHWIFEFPEVFLRENPGYDVVIGNPPFIRQEMINEPKEILELLYPEVYSGTSDYSVFFVKRSLDLLIKDGYHSFIITNKWLTRKYGERLRSYFKDNFQILQIIDFGDNTPFIGISNYVLIYVVRNSHPPKNNTIFYCAPGDPSDIQRVEEIGYFVLQKSLEGVWTFVREDEEEIKKWIEKVGKPLEEWDVKIYAGIKTGLNEAFIMDEETRKNLIAEDPKSAEIIKPTVLGKDIERWYIDWNMLYLLYIPWHFPLHNDKTIKSASDLAEREFKKRYPAVYNHLLHYKEKLSNRNKDETGIRYEWYALQRYASDYVSEFEKPKIIWQEMSKVAAFTWSPTPTYPQMGTFIMTNVSKYLLALLNSATVTWYFTKISPKLRGSTLVYKKEYLQNVPLIETNNRDKEVIEILVDYLLFLNLDKDIRELHSGEIALLDNEVLDTIVYELYFKEKFIEDSKKAIEEGKDPIYPQLEKGTFLIDLVAKHLIPIDYDSYAKLAYSIEPLSEEEKLKMEKMKEEYLKTIKEVVEAIKADEEIMGQIERIKSHEWVRVIEGLDNDT